MEIIDVPETLAKGSKDLLKQVYVTGQVVGIENIPQGYPVQDFQDMRLFILNVSKITLTDKNKMAVSQGRQEVYTSGTIGVILSKFEDIKVGEYLEIFKLTMNGNKAGINISNVKSYDKSKSEQITACAWSKDGGTWNLSPVKYTKLRSESPIYSSTLLNVKPFFALGGHAGVSRINDMVSKFSEPIFDLDGITKITSGLKKIGDVYVDPVKSEYAIKGADAGDYETLVDSEEEAEGADEEFDLSTIDLEDLDSAVEVYEEEEGAIPQGKFIFPPSASKETLEEIYEQISEMASRMEENSKDWPDELPVPTERQLRSFLFNWVRYVNKYNDTEFPVFQQNDQEVNGKKYLETFRIVKTFRMKGIISTEQGIQGLEELESGMEDVVSVMVVMTFLGIDPAEVINVDMGRLMHNPFKYLVFEDWASLRSKGVMPAATVWTLGIMLQHYFGDVSQINHKEWHKWASIYHLETQARRGLSDLSTVSTVLPVDNYNYISKGNRHTMDKLIDLSPVWADFTLVNYGKVDPSGIPDEHIFRKGSDPYMMRMLNGDKALEIGMLAGVVIQVGETTQLTRVAESEYLMYVQLQEKGLSPYLEGGVDREYIDEVQKIQGFDLSPEQLEALNLLRYSGGILTGEAGSGKTTVLASMVHILKKYVSGNIYCVAPTGIASRRIKNALLPGNNSNVYVGTMHSVLGLYNGEPYSEVAKKDNVLIIDETSMVNLNLMGTMQKKRLFKDVGAIYMFGDIQQLPPIGSGTPFRNLFEVLPNIRLGVSKRSLEGSDLYENILRISRGNAAALETADDFLMQSTSDEVISRKLVNLFLKLYAKNKRVDQLCIATPYQTEKKDWGSTTLNKEIQAGIYGGTGTPCILFENKSTFYLGDRVVCKKQDNRRDVFYKDVNSQGLKEYVLGGIGVVNGEVGNVTKIYPYESKEALGLNLKFRNPADHKKFVETAQDRGVLVEITFAAYSTDDKEYCALFILNEAASPEGNISPVKGEFRELYDLAYALTVHKLQGSTVEKVLIPVSSVDSPLFYNRNMLYTAVTRASSKAVLVGKVDMKVDEKSFSKVPKLQDILDHQNKPDMNGIFGYLCFYGEVENKETEPTVGQVYEEFANVSDDEILNRFMSAKERKEERDMRTGLQAFGVAEDQMDVDPF